ncbi:MAG TPA: SDR family oxidoreductase [Gemmatimonadales bacterium]
MAAGGLDGRIAIVTGASSGIGEATAGALAEQGARVALLARRADRLQAVADAIRARGGSALALAVDVTNRAAVTQAVERVVDEWVRVDVLVNNAGIMPLSPVRSGLVEDWDRMIDVNIKGLLYGIAAVLPHMLEQRRGHIVNVGSVAGRRPFPGGTVYSATKYAVRSISAGLRLELSPNDHIRVTDIEPGVVDTELTDHILDPAIRDRFSTTWAARRPLDAADVARAIVYVVTQPEHVNVNELLVRPTEQET